MPAMPVIDSRFELVDELGRGGMGIVYRARDRERGGEVALKALREVGSAELLRLKREFRVMCNVHHPNLVRLGELVERHGGWFFTMELVDGVDFLEWVGAPASVHHDSDSVSSARVTMPDAAAAQAAARRSDEESTRTMTGRAPLVGRARGPTRPPLVRPGPMFDEARLRTALRGVADGLAGLHRAGLVHRDVKPSNIKIDPSGRVVLLDFGVTIPLHDSDGELAGTFAYMAPEQAVGQSTSRTDWYAVGVMLFRAMTGYFPFPSTRHGLELKSSESAPSPDEFVRDLPRDLVSLCRALLAADPAKRAGESEVRAIAGPLLPLPVPEPITAPFIGRRREIAQLVELRARQWRDGSCTIALVVGASGVGKTSLVRRFLTDTTAVVLESRCDERESVPFNALDGIVDGLAQLVARRADQLPSEALDALHSADAGELQRLFPVFAGVTPRSTRRLQLSHEDSRAAAARALRALLAAIGRAMPLVLVIDDAQWADADSSGLLADVLAAPPPSVLLVVTARGTSKPALLAGLSCDEIVLGGLDTEDAVELATIVAARAPIDTAAIAREAEGHPMFIAELSRFAAERRVVAGSLDDALWARACDLPVAARRLLHVVVTDGAALSRPIAVMAAGLTPAEAEDAIAELRAARLIRVGDDFVEPYHDRVREALVGRFRGSDRAALHQVLARALEASNAPPERLAHHWAGAGDRDRAATAAEAAATRAADALAFERAAEWLAMALELGSYGAERRRDLLVRRADALTHAGHPRDAGHAFLEAARTGTPDAVEQRDLRRRAAERLLAGGYTVEGLEVARELLVDVGLPWPATRGAALRSLFWHHLRIGMSRLRWRPRAEIELSAEQKLRLDTCWSAAVGLAMLDPMRGTTFAMRALLLNLAAGEPRRIALALAGAAFAAAGMNQQRRFRRLTVAIERAAADTDAPEARCYVALADAARAYFTDNDWHATRDIAMRGLDVWTDAGRGHTWEVDLFEQFVGWAHGTAGDYRVTAEHAERVLRGARRRGDRFLEVGFRVQFPHRYLLDDRPDDGLRDVNDAMASWPIPEGVDEISNQYYWAWRARTMIALYASRIESEASAIEEGWRRIKASLLWQVPAIRIDVSVWAGAFALSRVAAARGNPSAQRAHLAIARKHLKVITASPLPARKGSAPLFRAVIAHLQGDDATAVEELRTAIARLDEIGMVGPAIAARWRLGKLIGGAEGSALLDAARAWLSDNQAVSAERMVDLGLPAMRD